MSSEQLPPAVAPRRRRRVFVWFFLAVQLIFVVWLVAGVGAASGSADCDGLDADACEAATAVGAGIGIFLILVLWVIVDFLLGVGYAVYRLARRP